MSATLILDLPTIALTVLTGNNEDWLDDIAFYAEAAISVSGEEPIFVSGDEFYPISLEGISFRMQTRKVAADTTAWIDASTDSGELLILGDDSNHLAINVSHSVMADIPPGDYVFDITATADEIVRTIATGTLTVIAGVTREGDAGT